MSGPQNFATQVNLPCRIQCGPKGSIQVPGMARRMDVRVLTLNIAPGHPEWTPKPAEAVVLEISLPGGSAKVLRIRGHVWRVQSLSNGSRQVEVHFRKAIFGDKRKPAAKAEQMPESDLVM